MEQPLIQIQENDKQQTPTNLGSFSTNNNKNWLQRTFSGLTPGSIRGSILTLAGSAIGTGVLTLPKLFSESGLIPGFCIITFQGMIAYWSLRSLMKGSIYYQKNKYSDLVNAALGKKVELLLEIVMILACFGAMTSYQITISNLMPQVLQTFRIGNIFDDNEFQRKILILIIAALLFPICCKKSLHEVQYFTFLGMAAVLYIVIVVIMQFPFYISKNDKLLDEIKLYNFQPKIFQSFGVAAFSYTVHNVFLPVISELKNPSQRRITKVYNRSVIFEILIYLCTGITGYLSVPINTPELITSKPSFNGQEDILMNIGVVAMAFHVITAIPLMLNPCRLQIINLITRNPDQSPKVYLISTFCIMAASVGLAILYPSVYGSLSILGGTGCIIIGITLPGCISIKQAIDSKNVTYKMYLTILVVIKFSLLGLASVIFTF